MSFFFLFYNLKEKINGVHFWIFPLQKTFMCARHIRIVPTLAIKKNKTSVFTKWRIKLIFINVKIYQKIMNNYLENETIGCMGKAWNELL